MKKHVVRFIIAALTLVPLFTFIQGCSGSPGAQSEAAPAIPPAPPLKVATGTTQIAAVVSEIGGDAVRVVNLVPPAQNPLKYELKPEDLAKLSGVDVLIIHDWQSAKFPQNLTDYPSIRLFQLGLERDWLLPSSQLEAAEKIATILADIDEKRSAFYRQSVAAYKKKVDYQEAYIIARAISTYMSKSLPSTNVICEEHLRDFFVWIGLDVSATFNEIRPLTDEEINGIIEQGKKDKVILVANSAQYSSQAGVKIASALNVELIFLTNFPGNPSTSETWMQIIAYDAGRLLGSS